MSIEYRPTSEHALAIAAGQGLGSLLLIGSLAYSPNSTPIQNPPAIIQQDQRSLFDPIDLQTSSIEELLKECRGKEDEDSWNEYLSTYGIQSKSRVYELY